MATWGEADPPRASEPVGRPPCPMLTVAAVARRLGVAPSTLRTWDRRYRLGPSAHTAGAHRRYGPADLRRLMIMRRLTMEGVPPAEAAEIALASAVSDDPELISGGPLPSGSRQARLPSPGAVGHLSDALPPDLALLGIPVARDGEVVDDGAFGPAVPGAPDRSTGGMTGSDRRGLDGAATWGGEWPFGHRQHVVEEGTTDDPEAPDQAACEEDHTASRPSRGHGPETDGGLRGATGEGLREGGAREGEASAWSPERWLRRPWPPARSGDPGWFEPDRPESAWAEHPWMESPAVDRSRTESRPVEPRPVEPPWVEPLAPEPWDQPHPPPPPWDQPQPSQRRPAGPEVRNPAAERGRPGGGRVLALPESSPQARGLARAAMALDTLEATRLLRESVRTRGVVATWELLVVPVLAALGERWQATGEGVDVEHALSEVVLGVLREVGAGLRRERNSQPILLCCPEDELHTLPLNALSAALAEREVGCRLLGAGMPGGALVSAVRRCGPAVVFLYARLPVADPGPLDVLRRQRPAPRIVLGGPGWVAADGVPGTALLAGSLDQAVTAVLGSAHLETR